MLKRIYTFLFMLVLRVKILLKFDFSGANLQGINFTGFNLRGLNFSNANLSKANLCNADLSETSHLSLFLGRRMLPKCTHAEHLEWLPAGHKPKGDRLTRREFALGYQASAVL